MYVKFCRKLFSELNRSKLATNLNIFCRENPSFVKFLLIGIAYRNKEDIVNNGSVLIFPQKQSCPLFHKHPVVVIIFSTSGWLYIFFINEQICFIFSNDCWKWNIEIMDSMSPRVQTHLHEKKKLQDWISLYSWIICFLFHSLKRVFLKQVLQHTILHNFNSVSGKTWPALFDIKNTGFFSS